MSLISYDAVRPDSAIRWQTYPAALVAGGLAAGVALEHTAGWGLRVWVVALVAGVLMAAFAVRHRRRTLVNAGALVFTLACGWLSVSAGGAALADRQALPAHHVAYLSDGEREAATVVGRVHREPVEGASGLRFVLDVDTVATAQGARPATGRIQVFFGRSRWGSAAPFPAVRVGDRLRLDGRLDPVPRRRNPADFDYGRYLIRHGMHGVMRLYSGDRVAVVGHAPSLWTRTVLPVREHVRRRIDRHIVGPDVQAIALALVLGDRSRLEASTREAFVATGLMHVLAVSGLHVMLIGFGFYGLAGPMLTRLRLPWTLMEPLRVVATAGVLLGYVFVSGAAPSVVRAAVMGLLLLGGHALGRSAHPLNTLGVAAVGLLATNPLLLFDVGFQLSFAAVAALVALPRTLGRLDALRTWPAVGRGLARGTIATVAATLGTLPVLLLHFGHASFAGLVLNPLAIPLTAGTLLATIGTAAAPTLGAAAFGGAADLCGGLLIGTAEVGAQVLGAWAVTRYVEVGWALGALGAALVALAQWPRPRHRWRWTVAAAACVTASLWAPALEGDYKPRLDVIFFDVGQGDAALLRLPNGKHLLVDAGPGDAFGDAAQRTLLPHLERYGIQALDAVVVTHPHADHLGGLPTLLRTVDIHRVIHGGDNYMSHLYEEAQAVLDSLAVATDVVRRGDTLLLDPHVQIEVLAPSEMSVSEDNVNEGSVVLRVQYGATSVLLTGDAEAASEAEMVAGYGHGLESDVVKVPHHGSRTSSSPAFAERAAKPGTVAVVSVAARNAFRLPNADALEHWADAGATVRSTAAEGAVWVRSDGERVRIVDWR